MLKAKEDVVWRQKDDVLILLKTSTGHYYTVNRTGASLWGDLIDKGVSLEQCIENICQYAEDTPKRSVLKADCEELIERWKSEDLIEQRSDR